MAKIMTKTDRCKGCGLCAAHCPKKCITFTDTMNSAGYYPIKVEESKCIACGSCYTMCPDGVYEILA